MKNILIFTLILLSITSHTIASNNKSNSEIALKYQLKGIELYKQKNNKLAKRYLIKSIAKNEKGKTAYYLGNVLMNLSEFENAIKYYYRSHELNFRKNDSIFNIACAHSLDKKPKLALYRLLELYADGDRNTGRIKRDPDLKNFRSSRYYHNYNQSLKMTGNGIIPKDEKEFRKYIFRFKQNYYPMEDPSPGTFEFFKDNTFKLHEGETYCCYDVGEWHIDDQGYLSLKLLGTLISVGFLKSMDYKSVKAYSRVKDRAIDVSTKELLKRPRYRKNKRMTWLLRYKNPIVDRIKLKDIRLNVIGFLHAPPGRTLLKYHKIGKFKRNKIIKDYIVDVDIL